MLQKENLERIFQRKFKDDGDNYVACCPVHDENTPSFYIHKEKNLVHCFGCGAKGNLVNFYKDYKGVDETEARIDLGLTLEDTLDQFFVQNNVKQIPPDPYPESWLAPFKKEIHKYVIRRGLHRSTLENAEAVYDHSRQRQVFPHRDRDGNLVGAIGRTCKEQIPRWRFYWGYKKGRYLYRIPRHSSVRTVWVVEGVFDALWLEQHGIPAVATLGSKPTKHQISEILENYENVVLAYDNDAAGIEGTRTLYNNLHRSLTCYFILWPKHVNDIMEVNPHDLELFNGVQWEIIRSSDRRSTISS